MRRVVSIATGILVVASIYLIVFAKPHKVWRVSNEVRIEQPVAVVFNYVTTASNWPRWHPASVAVKSIRGDVSKSGNIDDQIWELFRVAGRKGEIIWTVTKKKAPTFWQIRGEIGDGVVVGVITYKLRALGEGATLYERTFTSEVHSRRLNLLYAFYIHRRIKEESARAVEQLNEKLGTYVVN